MGTIQADVLVKALRKLGVPNANGTQLENALSAFNDMVSSLSAEDVFLPYHTRESFSLVAGTAAYTIGSGANFDTTRPEEIVSAYIRDSDGNDHPVSVDMTLEEYSLIVDKDASERPGRLCYLREYPNGRILFDTAPESVETIYIDSLKQIGELAAVDTALTIPPEYKEFFVYNLAARLAPEYNQEVPRDVYVIAQQSWDRIVNQNVKKLISTTAMDPALWIHAKHSAYNINYE